MTRRYHEMSQQELVTALRELEARALPGPEPGPKTDAATLLEDLRQHQIELEMQNRELREAQVLLEESRSRYADLYDFAPTGYLTMDSAGLIEQINLRGAALLEHPREALVGRPFSAVARLHDPAAFRHHLHECMTGRRSVSTELRTTTRDGGELVLAMVSTPFEPQGGRMLGRTVLVDITERKRAEESLGWLAEAGVELAASLDEAAVVASLTRLALRGLGDIARVDLVEGDGLRLAALAAREGLPVVEPAEHLLAALRGAVKQTVAGASRQRLDEPWFATLLDRVHLDGERVLMTRLSLRGGVIVPLSSRGRVLGALTVLSHRAVNESLADELARRAAVALENAQLYAAAQDALAKLRHAEGAQRFLAQSSVTLSESLDHRKTLTKLAHLAVPQLGDVCMVEVLDQGGSIRQMALAHVNLEEAPLATWWAERAERRSQDGGGAAQVIRDGTAQLLSASDGAELAGRAAMIVPMTARGRTLGAVSFLSAKGAAYHAGDLALAEDLASRAALAVDNARLYQNAQRAVQMREDALAIISHDLKNPVHGILMAARHLMRAAPEGERRERTSRWPQEIERSALRLSRLLDDLTDLASIENGHLSVQPTPCATAPLLEEAALAQQSLVLDKGLELRVEAGGDLPDLMCDRERGHQVLANLIGNAIKFTHAGSIVLSAQRRGDELLLCVADTGVGIAADELPHVFDRYWHARKELHGGTGLGLAISKALVELHGGLMWAESTPGRGSRFYFTLPIASPEVRAAKDR